MINSLVTCVIFRLICETCQSGRLPLYGEIVWVKYGIYKWQPAIIIPPWKIPSTLLESERVNYFCVRFFGTMMQYVWTARDDTFLYNKNDWKSLISSTEKKDYQEAIKQAKEYYTVIEEMLTLFKGPKGVLLKPAHYTHIKTNRAVPPVRLDQNVKNNDAECNCRLVDPNPCSETSACLNRSTSTECRRNCKAGDRCANQRFQKSIYSKVDVQKSGHKGWGLFAAETIKCGTFIIEYIGEVINLKEYQQRFRCLINKRSDNFYLLSLDRKLFIDAGFKGNEARFANHSCEPNSNIEKWTVNGVTRIGFFANKNIPTGSEITINYDWNHLPEGLQDMELGPTPCYCGTQSCSGFIGKPKPNRR